MSVVAILIDRHPVFRTALKHLLQTDSFIKVVAEGATEDEILELYEEYQPDIAIIEPGLIQEGGFAPIKDLLKMYPNARVVVLTTRIDPEAVKKALQAGAVGYLLKDMNAGSIRQALGAIIQGHSYIHPIVLPCLLAEYRRLSTTEQQSSFYQPFIRRPYHLLTKREIEILQLLAEGLSNQAIADQLFISEKTVKNHVSRVLDGLHVRDRTQAVVAAIKNGWVEI
ncbi:LuxR C-terminal-related transcriptional regulator [Planococcus lenghuensis]|uniref:DNA-binding response regulator n=1 Tax=Planococcus lenghuensis TaxID=2213202 RepID=A0A1Q2L5D5_9BACL|nr:response regulator transcription factor [Planococcus lenghuensis]AQQ55307.1 hypothetical protein B0X71_19220 [Planococcus lenghuensis]